MHSYQGHTLLLLALDFYAHGMVHTDIVCAVLEAWPAAIKEIDVDDGSTPLHNACWAVGKHREERRHEIAITRRKKEKLDEKVEKSKPQRRAGAGKPTKVRPHGDTASKPRRTSLRCAEAAAAEAAARVAAAAAAAGATAAEVAAEEAAERVRVQDENELIMRLLAAWPDAAKLRSDVGEYAIQVHTSA